MLSDEERSEGKIWSLCFRSKDKSMQKSGSKPYIEDLFLFWIFLKVADSPIKLDL